MGRSMERVKVAHLATLVTVMKCSCIEESLSDGQGDDSNNEEDMIQDIRYLSPSRYDREYRKTYGGKHTRANVYT